MKILTLTICILLCSNILCSQKTIDVTEQIITVNSMKTEELYFGFAAGDQIVFNCSERDKKELREIEVLEYPYNSKFAVFKKSEIKNEILPVAKTGVYRFRFYNNAIGSRKCKIKIQRIPASEETEGFNTKIVWHTQYDTGYYAVQQPIVKQEYILQSIFSLTTQMNSSSKGNKSRIIFPVQLPENTIEWYYRVSVLNVQRINETHLNLTQELTTLMKQKEGIQFGPEDLLQLPGEAYCDVYIMSSENATRFEAGDEYKFSLVGSSQHIKSGITKVYGSCATPLYLGINNPDSDKEVHIQLECVAIVLKEKKEVEDVQQMNVAKRTVPVLKVDDNISWAY